MQEKYSNEQEQWNAQLGVYLQKLHVEAINLLVWLTCAVQEEYSNEQEQWKAQLGVYLQKLHVEAHERTAAVEVAAKEQQELEQKLWEVGVCRMAATFVHDCTMRVRLVFTLMRHHRLC